MVVACISSLVRELQPKLLILREVTTCFTILYEIGMPCEWTLPVVPFLRMNNLEWEFPLIFARNVISVTKAGIIGMPSYIFALGPP